MPARMARAGAISGATGHRAQVLEHVPDGTSSGPEDLGRQRPPSDASHACSNSKRPLDRSASLQESVSRRLVADTLASDRFEAFAALVTCTYAVVIGVHSEITIKESLVFHREEAEGREISVSSPAGEAPVFQVLSYIFAGYYLLESSLKIFAFRRSFFTSRHWKWNVFELLLVVAALYEIVTDLMSDTEDGNQQGGGGEIFLLVLRLLKLVKLLRLIRLMRFFHELRTMLLCIVGSLRTLFWTLLMLGLILYIFGIVFIQGVIASLVAGTSMETRALIEDHWGSVGGAMTTLFEAITGGNDWAGLAQPLQEAGFFYYMLFLFYILFLTIAVLNVLTGIFVDSAMAIGTVGKHEVTLAEHAQEGGMLNMISDLLASRGMANSELKWADFMSLCEEPVMHEFFAFCDLDVPHAEHVFEQMEGANRRVLSGDFITGCLQMRAGAAKSLDVCVLMHETKKLAMRLDSFAMEVQGPLAELLVRVGGGDAGPAADAAVDLSNVAGTAGVSPSIAAVLSSPPLGATGVGAQNRFGGVAEYHPLLISLPSRVAAEAAAEVQKTLVQALFDATPDPERPGNARVVWELHRLVPKILLTDAVARDDKVFCNSGSTIGQDSEEQPMRSGCLQSSERPSSTRSTSAIVEDRRRASTDPAKHQDESVECDTLVFPVDPLSMAIASRDSGHQFEI